MRRAYKFRLYPNTNQERELLSSLDTHRRIYNAALAQRKDAWEQDKKSISFDGQYKYFAARRNAQIADEKAGECGPFWLARISAVSMRDTLKRLDVAFQNFFRRCHTGEKPGYPRFRGKDRYDSIPFDNYNAGAMILDAKGERIFGDMDDTELRGCKLRLFGVGNVKVKVHRPIVGKIKTVTVKREADKWFVVFSCDLGPIAITPSTKPEVGIDVGLTRFLTTSEGKTEPNPRYLKTALPELRREQRSLSRKKKGGANRRKQKHRVAKLHQKVKNLRREHHYQVACKLVLAYGIIAAEGLNIQGMLKNLRYARAISDAAWGGFLSVLRHKAESAGAQYVEVDPRGTTQRCSECNALVVKDITVRWHDCHHCGLSLDRDHNAALNILARARAARTGPIELNGGVGARARRSPCPAQTTLQQPPREAGEKQPTLRVRKPRRSQDEKQIAAT